MRRGNGRPVGLYGVALGPGSAFVGRGTPITSLPEASADALPMPYATTGWPHLRR